MFARAVNAFVPGDIKCHGRNALPAGWLWCDGTAVSRTTYAALFAAIGTAFGAGDGATTFNVPDLRGRVPLGKDNMGGVAANRVTAGGSGINGATLGAVGGAEVVTLSVAQIPSHTHATDSQGNHSHTYNQAGTANLGFQPGSAFTMNAPAATSVDGAHTHTAQPTGGGGAHNNMVPVQVVHYIIKT